MRHDGHGRSEGPVRARTPTSGCAAGGWCSAADAADGTGCGAAPAGTRRWTGRWPRSTAPRPGGGGAAPAAPGAPGSAARRRGWPAGSATSARTSPARVVQVMQRDAIDRLGLPRCCWSRRCWRRSSPTCTWSARCSRCNKAMPETTKETARAVVRKVVDGPRAAARQPHPGRRHRRARPRGPDQPARGTATSTGTAPSAANLKHYLPEHRTVVPERLVGYGRAPAGGAARTSSCASTSPARWPRRSSTPRSSARCSPRCGRSTPGWSSSTPRSSTSPTQLDDPVDVLFGTQLGGGTDINRALAYCQAPDHPARRHRPRPDQRPLRGRHPRRDAASGSRR